MVSILLFESGPNYARVHCYYASNLSVYCCQFSSFSSVTSICCRRTTSPNYYYRSYHFYFYYYSHPKMIRFSPFSKRIYWHNCLSHSNWTMSALSVCYPRQSCPRGEWMTSRLTCPRRMGHCMGCARRDSAMRLQVYCVWFAATVVWVIPNYYSIDEVQ